MKQEMEIKDYIGAVPAQREKNDATIYLRFPTCLKRRIERAAAIQNISVNTWMNNNIRRDLDGLNR